MSSSVEYPEGVAEMTNSQNLFTMDLYQRLIEDRKDNLFFSPFSIMTAIAMTHMGAKSNTEQQIQTVFRFPDKQIIKNVMKNITSVLKTSKADQYELNVANGAYISHLLKIRPEFVKTLESDFNSKIENVNYNAAEVVRNQINTFVEEATRSKIKDLIPKGILNAMTRLVLVNAIYFKGFWEHQFDSKLTTDQSFWLNADSKINVPMMSKKKNYKFSNKPDINAKVISLDYRGNEMSMVIVLPNERDGLAKLESKLATVDLASLDASLYHTDLTLKLPKFKLENSFELSDVLQKMGIKDLFTSGLADLSGISEGEGLYVSQVIHKSFIEVNEEGSEAAAATVGVMFMACMMEPITFLADHPFFFFIKHNALNEILFVGRLVSPI